MPEENNIKTKIDIAKLKKDVEITQSIAERLNVAIERLTDVSTSIKSMLAVHAEKISRQEQIDEVIFDKLKERADKIDDIRLELTREIQSIEKRLLIEIKNIRLDIGQRVGVLEKHRWIIIGVIVAIGWILSVNFGEIVQLLK
jgi:predicted  nucleic acid-binding Zn-ribbon protein